MFMIRFVVSVNRFLYRCVCLHRFLYMFSSLKTMVFPKWIECLCAANKGLIIQPETALFYFFFSAPSVNDAIAGK